MTVQSMGLITPPFGLVLFMFVPMTRLSVGQLVKRLIAKGLTVRQNTDLTLDGHVTQEVNGQEIRVPLDLHPKTHCIM